MNEISILNYIIPNSQILNGSLILNNSMICDELSADQATFKVNYDGPAPILDYLYSNENDALFSNEGDALATWEVQSDTIDLNSIPYGTPFIYSYDNNVIGKFYAKSITQTGPNTWAITGQSAIGVLIEQEHNGGIYSVAGGDTVESVIDEIMAGLNIPYTVAPQFANQYVSGHLPVASCRDNLQQLCFAFGISVMKDTNGDLVFEYNQPETPEAVLIDDNIYMGGTKKPIMPISRATVYEHAFYAVTTQPSVVVFDNTNDVVADNLKIIFENPIIVSTLSYPNTITVDPDNINENYIIVSGTGVISAVEYTHTIKVLTQSTGVTTTENKEIVYKDATLVNALNSENCLKRVAAYYSQSNEISYDLVVSNERAGELVQYPDPFTSETRAGLIKQMSITVSGILKSATRLTENWMPNYLGNNYTEYELVTSGVSWTADRTGQVRIFLVGGGNGGNGGYNGSGQTGGQGSLGGTGGKVYAFEINVTQGTTYTISLGTGGAGGASNNGTGSDGTDTTITINGVTYSSASGVSPADGLINSFNGDVYAMRGEAGVAGEDGGLPGWTSGDYYIDDGVYYYRNAGTNGGDVTYKGSTYFGGIGGTGSYYPGNGYSRQGGGGGGAAVGNNGTQGGRSNGGAGANASMPADEQTTTLACGGHGGHGGGGGGKGGVDSDGFPSADGAVGTGSTGGQGGDGFIMVYK